MSSTKVVNVTPTMAQKWLKESNTHNRNPIMNVVQRYAQDMKNHGWALTHQGIAFDVHGTLLDGQHRLMAIIESGETIPMLVTTGLPKRYENGMVVDTIDLIDRGKSRPVGQQIQLSHGYKHGNQVAAAAKVIAEICCGHVLASATTPQTLAVLEVYGKSIAETIGEVVQIHDRRAAVMGTLAFAKHAFPEDASRFSHSFLTMENIPKGSSVLVLRKWLANHVQHGSPARWATIAVVASAFHHFRRNSKIERLYGSDEHLAELVNAQKRQVKRLAELFATHQ